MEEAPRRLCPEQQYSEMAKGEALEQVHTQAAPVEALDEHIVWEVQLEGLELLEGLHVEDFS